MEEPVGVQPIPAHEAFAQVLTHAHSFDPESPVETAGLSRDYLDLVARVPVVQLRYKPDFSEFHHVVAAVLQLTGGAEGRRRSGSPVMSRS